MVSRFAGDDIASFLGSGPNMSALAQKSAVNDAKETMSNYANVSAIGGAGATQLGQTLAQGAVSEAQGNLASAQAQAEMMSSIGKLGGSLVGGLGSMGSSYSGFGSSGLNSGGKYGMAFDPSSVEAAMNTYGGYGI